MVAGVLDENGKDVDFDIDVVARLFEGKGPRAEIIRDLKALLRLLTGYNDQKQDALLRVLARDIEAKTFFTDETDPSKLSAPQTLNALMKRLPALQAEAEYDADLRRARITKDTLEAAYAADASYGKLVSLSDLHGRLEQAPPMSFIPKVGEAYTAPFPLHEEIPTMPGALAGARLGTLEEELEKIPVPKKTPGPDETVILDAAQIVPRLSPGDLFSIPPLNGALSAPLPTVRLQRNVRPAVRPDSDMARLFKGAEESLEIAILEASTIVPSRHQEQILAYDRQLKRVEGIVQKDVLYNPKTGKVSSADHHGVHEEFSLHHD
jgi:hypothetical protein